MVSAKLLRAACLVACAGLCACTPTRVSQAAPSLAQAETPAPVPGPAEPAAAPAVAPPHAAPERPAHKAAGKSFPKRKVSGRKPEPPPVVNTPEPPPVAIVPAISPEQERARRRDEYIAALQKAVLTFNPPSPIEVEQRVAVTLSVNPPKETAQLAEDLRKSLSAPEAWRPRLRARLSGANFEIAPAEGKDFAGEKDLSMAGRIEWSWDVVPKLPGTQQLTARVTILLPPELGEPRELPALQRDIRVEATMAWTLGNIVSGYWPWILALLGIAIVFAGLLSWRKLRFAGES